MTIDPLQALAAGAVAVTPNRRLALHLKSEYDAAQANSGKSVWPSADALPYGAFLERTWQELALAENGAMLLSVQQEIALWETVIESSRLAESLLNPALAARAAREAWITLHAFHLDHPRHRAALDNAGDDSAAFSEWRRAYDEKLRTLGWIDSAQLPDLIAQALANGTQPRARQILRAGYDIYTPQQQQLFDAFAQAGCGIYDVPLRDAPSGKPTRHACDDAEVEFMHIAARVRALLTAHGDAHPRLRIGVVVPDLAARRAAVLRVFDDVLEPLRVTVPHEAAPRLFNCSLGLSLTSYPVVFKALFVLGLAGGDVALEEAGVLLRSPYLGGADAELAQRARVDAALRARGRQRVTPGALRTAAHELAPRLATLLEPWLALARDARGLRQPPSAWSATFLALLKVLGWPGERTLDSAEYQTFEKFRDVLSGLSALDPLRPRITYAEALSVLRRLASDTVFQPETVNAPVQILGTLESIGLSFDALFVTGMAGESWPAAPRPNPFLPVALQRALGAPHASAEWELHFARRMTQAWLRAAPQVTFTWPQRDGERELTVSPLIEHLPETATEAEPIALLRDALFDARRFETLDDWRAPPLSTANGSVRVSGGAQMFQNQAACPFRAYAIHRLGASGLEEGADGLDARDRGTLAHQALAVLWRDLGSQATLLGLNDAALEQKITGAVKSAVDALCQARPDIMTDAFAALERTRLAALVTRLATLEKSRAPFEVVACEQVRAPEIAGVQLHARLDRVDQLDDGSQVILDYKTGATHIGGWVGERPDEPQLPLYAVDTGADVSGVAFVQLRAREVAFKGLTREEEVLPDVGTLSNAKTLSAQAADWPALLASWRRVLEELARDYLAGHAEVAPKLYPKTCEYCDLSALCRVRELMDRGALNDAENA